MTLLVVKCTCMYMCTYMYALPDRKLDTLPTVGHVVKTVVMQLCITLQRTERNYWHMREGLVMLA